MKNTILFVFLLAMQAVFKSVGAVPEEIPVERIVDPSKLIPVSMSGFTGEVQEVLKFDLEVAGLEFVTPDKARFTISGQNNGQVEGRVFDRNKTQVLARAYTGSNARSPAHALANDIILAITQQKGIAQSRIAFKVEARNGSEIYIADYDGHNAIAMTQ